MGTPQFFSIKNFENFQHYKTRNPPWIKLYRSILNDYEMRRLSVQSRLLYISLLIIASETENRIPVDYKFLSERTGIDVQTHDVTALIDSGFLLASHASISMLAPDALCSSLLSSVEKDDLSSLNSLNALRIVPSKEVNLKSRKSVGKSSVVWEAYRGAFLARWKVDPIRDRQTNGMLCKLIEKLSEDTAAQVAVFYLTHNKSFYVENRHPVNVLLRDCHGLHTQWATGLKSTTGEARNAEKQDEFTAQVKRVEALLQGGTL
jgi:hypothetical protein